MKITKLEQMLERLQGEGKKKRLVAAYANDSHTLGAVSDAIDRGIIEAILVGDEVTIQKVCKEEGIDVKKFSRIVQEADEQKAASKAVELINAGEGDILMKGLVSTDKYMRAILNKEKGLMPPKAILSHVAVMEVSTYHKLIIASDMAIIRNPTCRKK